MFQHYGEAKARKLIGDMMTNLKIVKLDGHLALARAIGLGEYAATPNNYTNLTINVGMAGFFTTQGILWGPMAAAAVVCVLPTLLAALVLQRYMVRGLTFGAVK
jgi:hypothetical protein